FSASQNVKDAVGKAVKIHAANVRKANRIERRAFTKTAIGKSKVNGKFESQTRTLVLIPIEGRLQVSFDERMPSEHEHGRTPETIRQRPSPRTVPGERFPRLFRSGG